MANWTVEPNTPLFSYLQGVAYREPEILQRLREETAALHTAQAQMQISPLQGQFLRLLVELTGARKSLEIGVFTGYSALSVALAMPAEGRITACDINKEWTATAHRYWKEAGVDRKIDLRLGPASATLKELAKGEGVGRYDFAFIDADKPSYDAYYELTLPLLRPGGLIALDNVLRGGRVADPTNSDEGVAEIRALNEKIHRDERVTACLLPFGDGMTLARKRP